ncbi:MAG: LacI family transcriptional regulator [Flavobacterium sp.]|nr:MAG: LacI family transcriptional regulator [Flavobacterium sp.]
MKTKRTSIREIALKCGTSITTVSFVINGLGQEKNISTAMIAKIQKHVNKVGYRPHSMAQGLRTGKSKTIGFLVDDISEPFYSGIAKYVDEKAAENGYKILFCCTGSSKQKMAELLSMLSDRQMDGYIMALAEGVEDQIAPLLSRNVPMVLFDRYLPDINCDQVIVDNYDSVYKATLHLIEQGYAKITYIGPITSQQQMIDRCNGYLEAMKVHSLTQKVIELKLPLDGDNKIGKVLRSDLPEAFIFAANYIAMHVVRKVMEIDQLIVNKVAMVSFDDLELFKFLSVPITAIEQPIKTIADRIMEIMIKRLAGKGGNKSIQTMVQTNMNIRLSSKKKEGN